MPKYIIEREIPGAGVTDTTRPADHFSEIMQCAEQYGATHPMAGKLRDG